MRCPSQQPIPSTCCTPLGRPGGRRESCATTAATPSHCCGACGTSTTPSPATCSGPPPTSAGWSATPTSCTGRCCSARPRCSTRASRWVRAIKKEDPDGVHMGKHDLSALQVLYQAGERLDPDTYHWASQRLGIPVVDHWWQTETGWATAA